MDKVSAANIGLAFLENAVLEVLSEGPKLSAPGITAGKLGVYKGIYGPGDRQAGSLIVSGVLAGLEKAGRVQKHKALWELTKAEKVRRGLDDG